MTISRRDARLPLALGLASLAAAFSWPARGAPPTARQSYVVTDFDTVRLEAPVEVVLTTGRGSSAVGNGDRDLLEALDFTVSARTLTIRLRQTAPLNGTGSGGARAPTRVALTTGELHRAIVMGTGTFTIDRLKGERTEATVRGAGTLTIGAVESDRLDAGLLGAGTLKLGGAAIELMASVSGSGRLDAATLNTHRVRLEMEGSPDTQLNAREEATVFVSGTGRLVVTGPAHCAVRKLGNANITCGGQIY